MISDEQAYNRFGAERIGARQIDELIGLARGLACDGAIDQGEVEFLQRWLAANAEISDQPVVRTLYARVNDILADGVADARERAELLETLGSFSGREFELGEALKPTTLPLCNPYPVLSWAGRSYCFTGTFSYGKRGHCEQAVVERGASAGSLTQRTNVLVIGAYVTESWKHSTFGNKIIKAARMRDEGVPIAIVSEAHWVKHL